MKKYIVSEDIGNLLGGKGLPANFYKDKGLKTPDYGFIEGLRYDLYKSLKSIFPKVEVFKEQDMNQAMFELSERSRLHCVCG